MNPIVKLRASAQPPPLEATQPATYSKGERGSTVLSVVVAPVNSNVALWMSPSSVDKLWFSDSLKHQCNISKPGTQNLTLTLPDKSVKYNVKLWYWLCLQALNKNTQWSYTYIDRSIPDNTGNAGSEATPAASSKSVSLLEPLVMPSKCSGLSMLSDSLK